MARVVIENKKVADAVGRVIFGIGITSAIFSVGHAVEAFMDYQNLDYKGTIDNSLLAVVSVAPLRALIYAIRSADKE